MPKTAIQGDWPLLANTTIFGGALPGLKSGNENWPGIAGETENSELKRRHLLRSVQVGFASEKGQNKNYRIKG